MGRDFDLIAVGEGYQTLIKSPMAEVAQGQTVARVVVVAFAPGDDVGGGHGGVTIGGEDAHAANGAAVVVGFDDGAAEQVAQFCVRFDEVGTETALGKAVEHGEEEQGFVGSAMGGNGRSGCAVFVDVEVGEFVQVVV